MSFKDELPEPNDEKSLDKYFFKLGLFTTISIIYLKKGNQKTIYFLSSEYVKEHLLLRKPLETW